MSVITDRPLPSGSAPALFAVSTRFLDNALLPEGQNDDVHLFPRTASDGPAPAR